MGLGMWAAAGVLAFGVARFLRSGGAAGWPIELAVAIASAISFGLVATAFDFGGWRELDWRAGAFALAGAGFVLALLRFARLAIAERARH